MTAPFKTEAELCAAFLACVPATWVAYPESCGFDIVLAHEETGAQIGIEAKLTLNSKVLVQVTDGRERNANGPDYMAVLVGRVVCAAHDNHEADKRAETAEAKLAALRAQIAALTPPPDFKEGAAIGYAQAMHDIKRLRTHVERLTGALTVAASHLWFAANKMKGRCRGSDIAAVSMAEQNARAALTEGAAPDRPEVK